MAQKSNSFFARLSSRINFDLIYLYRGGSWLVVQQIVTNSTSLILAILYARYLSQATFGNFNFIFSLIGILAIISLPGLNTVLGQSVAKGYEGTFPVVLNSKQKWAILASFFALIFAGYYYFQSNFEIGLVLVLVAFTFPILISSYLYDSYLTGRGMFKQSAIIEVLFQLQNFIVMALVIVYRSQLVAIFVVYLVTTSLFRWGALNLIRKNYPPNNLVDPKAISYGKHVSIIGAVGFLSAYLDSIIVFYLLGPVSLAIYTFAILPADKIAGMLGSISTLAMPKISRATLGRINEVLFIRMFLLAIVGLFISFIYLVVSKSVFQILFPKYITSVSLSQIFVLSLIFRLPTLLLSAFGQAKITLFPKKFLYLSNIIPQVIFIISLYLAGLQFGILGIVITKVVYSLVVLLVGIYNWYYLNQIRPTESI